jgi:transcriptional regulator of aromatic amino acid metabolism
MAPPKGQTRSVPVAPPRPLLVPPEEMRALRQAHPNVLVVGPDAATDAALNELYPVVRRPIIPVDAGAGFHPPAEHAGTVVLRNVGALTPDDQRRLLDWLTEVSGMTQTVTTSAIPLTSSLETGTFLDALYYRLNVMYLEVGES